MISTCLDLVCGSFERRSIWVLAAVNRRGADRKWCLLKFLRLFVLFFFLEFHFRAEAVTNAGSWSLLTQQWNISSDFMEMKARFSSIEPAMSFSYVCSRPPSKVGLVNLGLLFISFSKQTSFVPQVISPPGNRQNRRLVLSLLRCDPNDSRLQQLRVFRYCSHVEALLHTDHSHLHAHLSSQYVKEVLVVFTVNMNVDRRTRGPPNMDQNPKSTRNVPGPV